MIAKNCDGQVPAHVRPQAQDQALLDTIDTAQARAAEAMATLNLGAALEAIWSAMSDANGYFADNAPWALRKTDAERADSVLYTTAEALRRLAIMASWAIPTGAARMLDLLAVPADARDFAALAQPLHSGTALPQPQAVFPRLDVAAE
jgi:methionyl-tRNA synthetase